MYIWSFSSLCDNLVSVFVVNFSAVSSLCRYFVCGCFSLASLPLCPTVLFDYPSMLVLQYSSVVEFVCLCFPATVRSLNDVNRPMTTIMMKSKQFGCFFLFECPIKMR